MEWDKLPRECPTCGGTNWVVIDNTQEYAEYCKQCCAGQTFATFTGPIYRFNKKTCLEEFECPECGGLSGTPEENKKKFGIRCSNCGKLTIYLEKNEISVDHRTAKQVQAARDSAVLKCPKCGSTQITTGARGVSWTRGLIGASKTVNRCGKCGYAWKPRG